MKKIIIAFGMLSLSLSQSYACIETRAAIDIGSGETKMKVARVNYCEHRILEVLADGNEARRAILFKQNLRRENSDGNFTAEIMAQGLTALRELKAYALQRGATSFKAVATSAFRSALNASAFVANIKQVTDLDVQVISQEEEALLGYYGALADVSETVPNAISRIVVWDVGGGSMQFITEHQGELVTSLSEVGAAPFRQFLQNEAAISESESINPIQAVLNINLETLLGRTRQLAQHSVLNETIRTKLRDPQTLVVGIGGMHYYGVMDAFNGFFERYGFMQDIQTYTQPMLYEVANEVTSYDDIQIQNMLPEFSRPYYAESASNMVMILGFMQDLHIPSVLRLKVTLANALLVK